MKNARHMKYTVMKYLDGDFLFQKGAVTVVHNNDGHRIMTKPRGYGRSRISPLYTIPLRLASPEYPSLLNLDDAVVQR
jgi:hypothetical protein